MGALMLLMLVTTQAFAADAMKASAEDGYGRVLLTLDPAAHAQASLEGAVLKIAFDRKVTLDPATIAAQLPAYVTGGRADADGKTLRFALSQTFKLHSSMSGNRTAIDLVPEGSAVTPPDLPKPVVAAPKPVDPRDAIHLARARGHLCALFPHRVRLASEDGLFDLSLQGHLSVRFQGVAQPDFSAVERLAPPWVKQAGLAHRRAKTSSSNSPPIPVPGTRIRRWQPHRSRCPVARDR